MNPALAGVALAVIIGGVVAGSTRHARTAAVPFRSVLADAAVGDVLMLRSVEVGMTRTDSTGKRNSAATSWRIFVFRPWPISVPP